MGGSSGVVAAILGALVLGLSGAAAHAGPPLPDVAIVAAAVNTTMPNSNPRFTDVRDKLMATGLFNSVAIFNATAFGAIPTLAELQAYKAVIVWSNDSFDDAVAMGDVLADYVDGGGGVVVSVFANTSTNPARYLQGRWLTGNYIGIPQNGGFNEGAGELGAVLVPGHPIMQGVTTFVTRWGVTMQGLIFGGYRPNTTTLTPGSTKIATWNTGHTLVALTPNPRVVELGFHPVSSDVNGNAYWDAATDGDLIMANALLFTIPKAPSCPADLDGDGQVGAPDLSLVLGSWGPAPGSPADFDGSGDVGAPDMALLLGSWGPCP